MVSSTERKAEIATGPLREISNAFAAATTASLLRITSENLMVIRSERQRLEAELPKAALLMSRQPPFNDRSSPDSQMLVQIKKQGVNFRRERFSDAETVILFDYVAARIDTNQLPSEFEYGTEKVSREDVLSTLGDLNLIRTGHNEGYPYAQLTPLGDESRTYQFKE